MFRWVVVTHFIGAKQNLAHPPRAVLETAIRQNQGSIGFYEGDLFETAGQTAQLAALKAEAARVVPVLQDYQRWLEQELAARSYRPAPIL